MRRYCLKRIKYIMTKLHYKALFYQLLAFAALFLATRFLVASYTSLSGIWLPVTSFVAATLLAPKFQVFKTQDGNKMFMSWIFLKGVREVR